MFGSRKRSPEGETTPSVGGYRVPKDKFSPSGGRLRVPRAKVTRSAERFRYPPESTSPSAVPGRVPRVTATSSVVRVRVPPESTSPSAVSFWGPLESGISIRGAVSKSVVRFRHPASWIGIQWSGVVTVGRSVINTSGGCSGAQVWGVPGLVAVVHRRWVVCPAASGLPVRPLRPPAGGCGGGSPRPPHGRAAQRSGCSGRRSTPARGPR